MEKPFYTKHDYQYKRLPLDEAEQQKLISACKNFRERFVVLFLINTGLRVEELCNMKYGDVSWQDDYVKVYGKRGRFGTDKKFRVVPLNEPTKEILQDWFKFYGNKRLAKRTMQRIVKEVARRSGITKKISCHVLRHTYAVNNLKKGVNLRALQLAMGHSHITTTEIYLNLSGIDVVNEFKKKGA